MNYFDTSALIKLFVDEKGSEVVSTLVVRDRSVVTAKIAYAEVYAGLVRKHRTGTLSVHQLALARRQFEEEWPTYIQVDLRDDILVLARDLIDRHPLRAVDAVHLASALSLRQALGQEVRFVAADARLLQAAAAEHCSPVNVETTSR